MSTSQIFQHASSSGIVSTCTISSQKSYLLWWQWWQQFWAGKRSSNEGPGKWQNHKHSWPSWDSPSSPWDHHRGLWFVPSLGTSWVQSGLVVVHPFTQDDCSVQFWYIPSLRTTSCFSSWYVPSLRTTSRFGSWYVPSLRMTFSSGWWFQLVLSLGMAVNAFQVLQFLFAPAVVNRSNPWFICVGNPVVPKEEWRKNECLAWAGWWLIANEWLITNNGLTKMTCQMSASWIFQQLGAMIGSLRVRCGNQVWW